MLFKPRSWKKYFSNFRLDIRHNCYDKISSITLDTPVFSFRFSRIDAWIKPHPSTMKNMPNQSIEYYIYCGKISFGINLPCRVGDDAEYAFMNMTDEERDAYLARY